MLVTSTVKTILRNVSITPIVTVIYLRVQKLRHIKVHVTKANVLVTVSSTLKNFNEQSGLLCGFIVHALKCTCPTLTHDLENH